MRPSRCYLETKIARTLSRRRRPKVVLFGGSFHPAHAGHLRAATQTQSQLKPDAILWLISSRNPLKLSSPSAKPLHRRLYAQRLVRGQHAFAVSCLEERIGICYTIDTIAALRAMFPHMRLFWLIGTDLVSQLPLWHQGLKLLHFCHLAVAVRPPYSIGCMARLRYDIINMTGQQNLSGRFRPIIVRFVGYAMRASLIRRDPHG